MIFICYMNCSVYEATSSNPHITSVPSSKNTNTLSLISARELKQLLLIIHTYGNDLSKQKRKATSQSKIQCLSSFLATLVQIGSFWCQLHFVWIFTDLTEIAIRPTGF